jgi:hypothetical protein
MAHWRQMFERENKTLGSWDLEVNGTFESKVVTIERFYQGEIVGSKGKESKQMVKLKEFDKPMVCNVTNFKRLQKFFGTFEPNYYLGKQIVLGVEKTRDPSSSEQVDALRFSSRPLPQQSKKEIADADIPKVIKSIQSGATTLEALQQTREITAEQLVLINEGISNVEG